MVVWEIKHKKPCYEWTLINPLNNKYIYINNFEDITYIVPADEEIYVENGFNDSLITIYDVFKNTEDFLKNNCKNTSYDIKNNTWILRKKEEKHKYEIKNPYTSKTSCYEKEELKYIESYMSKCDSILLIEDWTADFNSHYNTSSMHRVKFTFNDFNSFINHIYCRNHFCIISESNEEQVFGKIEYFNDKE